MSRLKEFFVLSEMPRVKEEPIKAMLDWAAAQKGTFTARQLYNVYVANGGRSASLGDNYPSFRTQLMKMVARFWKDPPKNQVSQDRPIVAVKRGSKGGGGANPDVLKWGLPGPLRTGDASFVNPDDDENTGAAMDRLEKVLSRMGKGLPPDQKVGRQKLQAAIERWKKMRNLNQVVVDIKGTIPKVGQMDALHIASEFLMDKGAVDQDDVEDAEDQVAPTPSGPEPSAGDEEEDDFDFSDEPHVSPDEWESLPNEPDEEEPEEIEPDEEPTPPPPPPKPPGGVEVRKKPGATPPPTPEPEDDEDEVEPATKQQAGASTFLKPFKPAKKSPVSKWFKK
jgi:hypothetical protein